MEQAASLAAQPAGAATLHSCGHRTGRLGRRGATRRDFSRL